MEGYGLNLSLSTDSRYKFKRAADCDLTELESVLDYCAPRDQRKGSWDHNPQLQDAEETYKSFYETLNALDPNTRLTTAQYFRKALSKKETDSSMLVELTKRLAQSLVQHGNKPDESRAENKL